MRSRGTVTDKLFDVVQVLQTARKTGILSVTRYGENNAMEQATLKLLNGQVVEVNVDHLRGNEALNVLKRWRICYFMFQPSVPTGTDPSVPTVSMGSENGSKSPQLFSASTAVPYRTRHPNEVIPHFERLGLSRAHRQLFLLIDGKHTLPELMRLTGKLSEEMNILLSDLERLGLIQR